MSGKDTPEGLEGLGLSSEQYDEDQVLEVDNRSVDYDELREHAKNPRATWSQDAPTGEAGEDEPAGDHENDRDAGSPGESDGTTGSEGERPA